MIGVGELENLATFLAEQVGGRVSLIQLGQLKQKVAGLNEAQLGVLRSAAAKVATKAPTDLRRVRRQTSAVKFSAAQQAVIDQLIG